MTTAAPGSGDAPTQVPNDLPAAGTAVPTPRRPDDAPPAPTVADRVGSLAASPFTIAGPDHLMFNALQLTGMALWAIDLHHDRVSWSEQMSQLLGLPPGYQPSREEFRSWVHPEDALALARRADLARRNGTGWQMTLRLRPPDGLPRLFKMWCELLCDEQGEPTCVIGAAVDITETAVDAQNLAQSRRLLDAAVQLTGLAFWHVSFVDDALWWSDGMYALTGTTPGEFTPTQQAYLELLAPDDRAEHEAVVAAVMTTGTPGELTVRLTTAEHEVRYLRVWVDLRLEDDGRPVGLWSALLDVTEQERALQALNANEEQFRLAFDQAPNGMLILGVEPTRPDGQHPVQVVRANAATALLTGCPPEQLDAAALHELIHPDDRDRLLDLLASMLVPGAGVRSGEIRLLHPAGMVTAWVHAAASTPGTAASPCTAAAAGTAATGGGHRVLLHFIDVTALRRTEGELQRLALTDPITGLANRAGLARQVSDRLAGLAAGSALGLMLLDLDRFKVVNDSLGHVAGDALLVEVARRLTATLPPQAVVTRLGGDEFAVLISPCPSAQALADLADEVRACLARPHTLPGDYVVVCTASVGVTWRDDPALTVEDLYREADLALYRAKDAGRDAVAVFDDVLRRRADARIDGERRLRAALAADGVRVHLQPVVALETGEVVAAEALARIEHPREGMLMPNDFIPIAEDTGLVVEIDARVTELAIELLAQHRDDVAPRLAVNVSPRTLDHPDYFNRLTAALDRHGVDPRRLLVEVTESSLLDARGERARELARIQDLGIEVGIDDFGTGYSALAYLDRFRLDFLKIDRSFVTPLGTGERPDAVVAAIIALAHAHGLAVTAEGVETAEQAAILRAMGCDKGQGWHFGRPAPVT